MFMSLSPGRRIERFQTGEQSPASYGLIGVFYYKALEAMNNCIDAPGQIQVSENTGIIP
jgi:hypothetical protein